MNKDARKTIGYYLMLRSVSTFGISFITATYATFLISKGMNLFEVNLVNFVFFGTLFIFEIPTGAFADVFGRKLSFVLSCFLFSLGMLVYSLAGSFWWFALAEATAALGSTLASGAFQAWLVDRLRQQGYDGSIGKIFSVEQQIRNGLAVFAAIIGAIAADQYLSLPWFIGGCVMIVVGILAIVFMEEERFEAKTFSLRSSVDSMIETIRRSTRYVTKNGTMRFIVIMGLAQYFSIQAPNMQWQPFFGNFLSNKSSLGLLFAGMSISMAIGSALAPRFLGKVKNERVALSLSQIGIGAGICLTIFCGEFWSALAIFLVHEIARGLFVPLKDAYLNDNIPSKERATLISFESISHHVGGMIGLLVSGLVAQYVSMRSAWVMSGLVLIASTMMLLKNGRK